MLTKSDLVQLKNKGINQETIEQQLKDFKKGFQYAKLLKAATIGDGIIQVQDKEHYLKMFNKSISEGLDIAKFVPASGAATRMFKALFEFLHCSPEEQKELENNEPYQSFINNLDKFAFYEDLKKQLKPGPFSADDAAEIISALLMDKGLNYGSLPKGLLKFHKEDNKCATPLEEHLKETAGYGCNNNATGTVHFTVSPEHHDLFKELVQLVKGGLEKVYSISYDISFSFQKPSTDTIAVNLDNTPFRDENGELLFRPGGHGALIENLNDLNHDLIFIKNIDNVVPEHLQGETIELKKILAGALLEKKDNIFGLLSDLDTDEQTALENAVFNGFRFLKDELQVSTEADSFKTDEEKVSYLKDKLNRPIRVCGMVKNEGDVGGGPFWVMQNDGNASLQIVEGPQIDPNNQDQQKILKSSTHFNPVDLVCYVKDYKGNKFDLTNFIDHETGFISDKSKNGKPLKAMELPGLWNGAMANWITFFVEVPVSTFTPVKTVMDLLRPQHQPGDSS